MLINQPLDKLDALGLFGMALGVREPLESNQYLSLGFDERLGLLVDRETEARDSRRLALRLKAAKLRQEASVEDIDFRTPRGLDRSVIMSLAQANWVAYFGENTRPFRRKVPTCVFSAKPDACFG